MTRFVLSPPVPPELLQQQAQQAAAAEPIDTTADTEVWRAAVVGGDVLWCQVGAAFVIPARLHKFLYTASSILTDGATGQAWDVVHGQGGADARRRTAGYYSTPAQQKQPEANNYS